MSKKREQKSEYDARGVALSIPYPSSAEAPGGPESARATFASPGDAGVSGPQKGFFSVDELCFDCSEYESECACEDSCSGCGEPCNDDRCLCHPTCGACDDDSYVDFALEQFTFTCTPEALDFGDYQDCWSPDTYMAFWEDGEDPSLIVADTQSDARWRVINFEQQQRASSRPFYTWFCERIGVTDPCDEEYLRGISS